MATFLEHYQDVYDNQRRLVEAEKDRVAEASILTEVGYVEGFEDYAARFPILDDLEGSPLRAAFSHGCLSPNMTESPALADRKKGETPDRNRHHKLEFLQRLGFSLPPDLVTTTGKFDGNHRHIRIIETAKDYGHLDRELKLQEDSVVTNNPNITLAIPPADCPVGVMYGVGKDKTKWVGLDHMGKECVNGGMGTMTINFWKDQLGVDPSQIFIGIAPGMQGFWASEEPERGVIIDRNYGKYINRRSFTVGEKQKRVIDLGRASIRQYILAGVNPQNIQFIDIDTYTAAQRGESYSHRYSSEHGGERIGRFLIAVQLRPEVLQMPVPRELAMAA